MSNNKLEEEVEEVVEETRVLEDDFFYDEKEVKNEEDLKTNQVAFEKCFRFNNSYGFDSCKKNNVKRLDENRLIFSYGVVYVIYEIKTGKRETIFGRDKGGIGAIDVHPTQKLFAVGEKGRWPNIYIYSSETLKLYRILRRGTETSYSCLSFSNNGEKLASVGYSPDFTISIWDWKQEIIILKSKAFSQEIYTVRFSDYSENILTTSGLGHIKFWKVAETFTGLKLKGEIGKFGQIELSDIYSYFTFADGKVLSASEQGYLLLWEGNLIKCQIGSTDTKLCHEGCINVVFKYDNYIVTAGDDGFIKFWDSELIDSSEPDDDGFFCMDPLRVYTIKDSSRHIQIIDIICSKSLQGGENAEMNSENQELKKEQIEWIVVSKQGVVYHLNDDFEQSVVMESNSGKINNVQLGFLDVAVFCSQDGSVRLWDLAKGTVSMQTRFPQYATCLDWVPFTFSRVAEGRVVIVGFEDGLVRWLLLEKEQFKLIHASKIHQDSIKMVKCSPSGEKVVVLSERGDLFVIQLDSKDAQKIEPYVFFKTDLKVNDLKWDPLGEKILICCALGNLYEMVVPQPSEVDYSKTYEQNFNTNFWTMQMMECQKPNTEEMDLEFLLKRNKKDEKKEVEWPPESIPNVCYFNDQILISGSGKFKGYLYQVAMDKQRPVKLYPISQDPTSCLQLSSDLSLLLVGFETGKIQIFNSQNFQKFVELRTHDQDYGRVNQVQISADLNYVVSVADDCSCFSYLFDKNGLFKAFHEGFDGSKQNQVLDEELRQKYFKRRAVESSFQEKVPLFAEDVPDVLDSKIYSVQQAKLLAEEDQRRSLAEKKKLQIQQVVQSLTQRFRELKERNASFEPIGRLSEEEMVVDPVYVEMLNQRVEVDLEETRLHLKYDQEKQALLTQKLKNYMKDELIVDRFGVTCIHDKGKVVHTFKIKRLSEYVQNELKNIYLLFENEKNNFENQNKENQLKEKQISQNRHKDNQKEVLKQQEVFVPPEGLTCAKVEKLRHKWEEARIQRQLEELELTKPSKDSINPDHQKDIIKATQELGDFKLKSDPEYNVPKNQRMNDVKKKKHIFLLEEFIHNTKLNFNNEIIELRQRKKQLIEKSRVYNQRILEINQYLEVEEEVQNYQLNHEIEETELDYFVDDSKIDTYLEQQNRKKVKGQPEKEENGPKLPAKANKESEQKKESLTSKIKPRQKKRILSKLEQEKKEIDNMILLAEKKKMQFQIQQEVEQLDKDIEKCIIEKNLLESDLTVAQMKMITYFQELLILQQMKNQDDQLIKQLNVVKQQRNELEEQSQMIISDLSSLYNRDQNNEKVLSEQMKIFKQKVYPEDEDKREKIHQYFFRRYKKQQAKQLKLKNNKKNEEEYDEEDVDSDEEEDDEDLMEEDEEEKPDISQVEGDIKIKEVIDKICELEVQQEQIRKDKMDQERQKNQLYNKMQGVIAQLTKCENELKNFQRKKLQKLNQLDVSHFLRVEQILNGEVLTYKQFKEKNNAIKNVQKYSTIGYQATISHQQFQEKLDQKKDQNEEAFFLQPSLEDSILFTEEDFVRLDRRIVELQDEKKDIKNTWLKLENRKKILEKKILEQEKISDEFNKKLNEKHQLKFGDFIDLKILDALEPTQEVLDMKEKFKKEEIYSIKQIEKSKNNLQEKKKKLFQHKQENTKIIQAITDLDTKKMNLDRKLDSTNKQLLKEENEEKKYKNDLERERLNLKDLVKFLSKEIEDLKIEIGLFKRKGGHIYTMVTANQK